LLFGALTHSAGKAAIIAALFMLILTNFSFLEKAIKHVLPGLKYWHTAPIVLVAGLHIAYLLWRFLKDEMAADIMKITGLVFGGLILFNVAISTPQIINHVQAQRQLRQAQAERQEQQSGTATDMPNIYLIIFDEYANFPQMEEYYQYDNAPLRGFLEEHNFSISYTSHNDSIISSTILTNLVNCNYIVDNYTSESDRKVLRKNGALFDILRNHGYRVQIFETGDCFGGSLPDHLEKAAFKSGATTIGGDNLQDILLQRTIIYPIQRVLANDNSLLDNRVMIMADYLSLPEALPKGGVFTLAYFSFPHQPFLVNENGESNDPGQWENWKDPQYYLGQYQYATKQMLRILENIVNNDPNSIIILQSDHGARASTDEKFMTKFPLEVMNNPLNTVYYQGNNSLDISGLSSVNTLRIILNELFDLNYEIVPVPEDTYRYR